MRTVASGPGMLRKIIKYVRWSALAPIRLVQLSREVEKLNCAVGMMLVDQQMREVKPGETLAAWI